MAAKNSWTLRVTALSDRGLVRANNEDSAYAGRYVLALADGMGGHAAGEVASQLMISRLQTTDRDPQDNDMLALLAAAARDADNDISAHVAQFPETKGMGTTLSAMMFNGRSFGVIHVGDSRAYRLREGTLTQLTKDDTFVQSLVDEGKLDPEDVSSHPQKSLILKAYSGKNVEPTLFLWDAQVGDRVLLCSDGLSDPVTAATIESALGQGTLEEAATTLVELALRSGGPDNVTVVLAEVVDTAQSPASQSGTAQVRELADAAPVLVGAIAGEVPEPTHPDSSASRAAALRARPAGGAPAGAGQAGPGKAGNVPSTTQQTMAGAGANTGKADGPGGAAAVGAGGSGAGAGNAGTGSARRGSSTKAWALIAAILAVLVLVLAGGASAKHYMNNNYFLVAAEDTQELSIHRGADISIFGRSMHNVYQHACLNPDGELGLHTGPCSGEFKTMSVEDLPQSERGVVANLPSGSYDEVQGQLGRLADKALPACRTSREGAASTEGSANPEGAASTERSAAAKSSAASTSAAATAAPAAASESAAPTPTAQPTPQRQDGEAAGASASSKPEFRAEPGVNCRQVK
ncbi:PP2C family protein-serine/threonine phosphatase [Corynebacterium lizhenjunii]|uniref:PP2C family protein-serine/threonine phosphatase n=1 Tax=Corynebacterium lizhenjunii TaxID=2709394 RepID=UPI0013EE083D|nr:protein phosphatase 2C domain-containing protein [Corynebacterium lizhenjunii]